MKISELQELLEKAKEEYGDVKVIDRTSILNQYFDTTILFLLVKKFEDNNKEKI